MATWSAGLSVGVEAIDAQHQQLFTRADALLEAMRSGESRAQVKPLIDFLRDYCNQHFASEARLMAVERYPRREQHVLEHGEFTSRLGRIEASFEAFGATTAIATEVHELLCVWFVRHVVEVDKALAVHLRRLPD